jgi:hypothetical protein
LRHFAIDQADRLLHEGEAHDAAPARRLTSGCGNRQSRRGQGRVPGLPDAAARSARQLRVARYSFRHRPAAPIVVAC